jgi:hypothetical protein
VAIPIEAPDGEVALGLGAKGYQYWTARIDTSDLRLVLKMAPMIQRKRDIKPNPTTKDHRRPNRSIPNKMKMDVATI